MKVLICSEWSALNTGYGVMTEAIASRLAARGHDVAELAMYAEEGDQALLAYRSRVPWRVYPVVPSRQDKAAREQYDADVQNQFGRLAFHPALLHFRPDVVLNYQDPWYQQHVTLSPLRPFFRYLYIPPVDCASQKKEWLEAYAMADAVGTYTDWAAQTLEEEGGGNIPLVGSIPPGVDHATFRPHPDRVGLRRQMGLPEDALVVGFVSRNQVRKRFPELAQDFRRFLRTAPEHVASRANLYWHTSWPDVGWDVPRLVRDCGFASRLWFTYICVRKDGKCGGVHASRWKGAGGACPHCGELSAVLPRTQVGVSREVFPSIYNLFDAYVQYANSEGIGLGVIEAAACGVPVLAVDYSGMADAVRKLEGWPIAVKALSREVETGCLRAVPDGEDFCKQLTEALSLPTPVRRARGGAARDAAIRHYDWDRSVARMEEVFLGMPPALPWGSPHRPFTPAAGHPQGLSNADFVRWGFAAVAGRPDLAYSQTALRMTQELEWGRSVSGTPYFSDESFLGRQRTVHEVSHGTLMDYWQKLAQERTYWEAARCHLLEETRR